MHEKGPNKVTSLKNLRIPNVKRKSFNFPEKGEIYHQKRNIIMSPDCLAATLESS